MLKKSFFVIPDWVQELFLVLDRFLRPRPGSRVLYRLMDGNEEFSEYDTTA